MEDVHNAIDSSVDDKKGRRRLNQGLEGKNIGRRASNIFSKQSIK